jgi:hypothetical protein
LWAPPSSASRPHVYSLRINKSCSSLMDDFLPTSYYSFEDSVVIVCMAKRLLLENG